MKLLVDNALSPALANLLVQAGFDAVHVRDLGIQHARDEVILDRALAEARAVISADTDFGTLLAMRGSRSPSVVLWRRTEPRRPVAQAPLIAGVLRQVAADLRRGAIVVIQDTRVRVRLLPFGDPPA